MNPVDLKAAIQKAAAFFGGSSSDASTLGRIPQTVSINIGKKIIVANCVIENITIPLDKEKDKGGNLIRAEVQLDIQTKVMLDKSDIAGTWTGTDASWAAAQGSDWKK